MTSLANISTSPKSSSSNTNENEKKKQQQEEVIANKALDFRDIQEYPLSDKPLVIVNDPSWDFGRVYFSEYQKPKDAAAAAAAATTKPLSDATALDDLFFTDAVGSTTQPLQADASVEAIVPAFSNKVMILEGSDDNQESHPEKATTTTTDTATNNNDNLTTSSTKDPQPHPFVLQQEGVLDATGWPINQDDLWGRVTAETNSDDDEIKCYDKNKYSRNNDKDDEDDEDVAADDPFLLHMTKDDENLLADCSESSDAILTTPAISSAAIPLATEKTEQGTGNSSSPLHTFWGGVYEMVDSTCGGGGGVGVNVGATSTMTGSTLPPVHNPHFITAAAETATTTTLTTEDKEAQEILSKQARIAMYTTLAPDEESSVEEEDNDDDDSDEGQEVVDANNKYVFAEDEDDDDDDDGEDDNRHSPIGFASIPSRDEDDLSKMDDAILFAAFETATSTSSDQGFAEFSSFGTATSQLFSPSTDTMTTAVTSNTSTTEETNKSKVSCSNKKIPLLRPPPEEKLKKWAGAKGWKKSTS